MMNNNYKLVHRLTVGERIKNISFKLFNDNEFADHQRQLYEYNTYLLSLSKTIQL